MAHSVKRLSLTAETSKSYSVVQMASKILIVEDESDISGPLAANLQDDGFQVEVAETVQAARQLSVHHWDLVILDLMLPDLPGETFLNYLKQQPDYPSVLILTARGTVQDKLKLFRQGCDDYLTKPFLYEELLERVRALLRRSQRVKTEIIKYEDLCLDPATFRLEMGQSHALLTPKEASILKIFFSSPGRVVSRKEILENVWGLREEPDTNFIGVHLFNLRKKLNEVGLGSWLQTVRSSGFVFSKPESVEK